MRAPGARGILAAIGAESLYGLSYVVTRGALDRIEPLALLAWRFDVALVVMVLLVALRVVRLSITRRTLPVLALLAVFDPVGYYLAETLGVQRTSASVSGLVLSAIPVASLVAVALLLGTRPSRRQVVGVVVTLLGVAATVLATGGPVGAQGTGYVMLLLAVVSFALYTVAAERATHTSDADKSFVMIAAGALVFSLTAIARPHPSLVAPVHDAHVGLAVLILALGSSVGAYLLQNVAISALGAASYSTFIGVSTVVALVAGALVLGETLTAVQWVGGVAILAGVYIANRR